MKIFWMLLVWACVAWYGSITLLVAIRGFRDIRTMLERLRADGDSEEK